MAYSAYESSATSALGVVQGWCRHLTAEGTFSTASFPTLSQVEKYLTFGQADVATQLIRYGYGTAAPSNSLGLQWLEKMNCIRACMNIEMSYPITEWGKPNQRMMMFESQWNEGVDALASGRLIAIGIVGSASAALSSNLKMTGLDLARKNSREEDTNRVSGKFVRGFGQNRRGYFDPNSS